MNTPRLVVNVAALLALTGCSLYEGPFGTPGTVAGRQDLARHIEIEVGDLESGLPCKVIDRRNADTRQVLWHAEFEEGFCRRKAEETRFVLQRQGWACRPENADEQRTRKADTRKVVAAWRCVDGLAPTVRLDANAPPVPAAKPDRLESRRATFDNETLRSAVEKDLATIGQNVIGDDTKVNAAQGDLDGDGIDDAVVVLTRMSDLGAPHRLLMAYLHNSDAYHLVDVWILKAADARSETGFHLAIENGTIRLEGCCEDRDEPMTLKLDNRKLAYAHDQEGG